MNLQHIATAHLICHWCKREGHINDAARSVKLVNGTTAGICHNHLTSVWDADQILAVEEGVHMEERRGQQ